MKGRGGEMAREGRESKRDGEIEMDFDTQFSQQINAITV